MKQILKKSHNAESSNLPNRITGAYLSRKSSPKTCNHLSLASKFIARFRQAISSKVTYLERRYSARISIDVSGSTSRRISNEADCVISDESPLVYIPSRVTEVPRQYRSELITLMRSYINFFYYRRSAIRPGIISRNG